MVTVSPRGAGGIASSIPSQGVNSSCAGLKRRLAGKLGNFFFDSS